MFRRRRSRTRYARSPRAYRRSRRSSSKLGGLLPRLLGGVAYGAVREPIAAAVKPYTDYIPAGEYADEVGMGLIAYAAGKFIPSIKPLTDAAITIEAARIGSGLASGMFKTSAGSSAAGQMLG